MKKILKLKGVQELNREQQKHITGANLSRPYCKGHNQCCVTTCNGVELCDYGYCVRGGCIWA